ncbi:MAG: hypothetical protein LQ350_003625 [Teloschistes chrysophthalmus]|nr:MAG: hypothetical protein LQ350_003625 [Niorma chrysophthalma]
MDCVRVLVSLTAFLYTTTTTAIPIDEFKRDPSSETLSSRAQKISQRDDSVTHDGSDKNISHRGTTHCFPSGSFLRGDGLRRSLLQACTTQDVWNNEYPGHFNFTPNARGQYAPQLVDSYIPCVGHYDPPPGGHGPGRCRGSQRFHIRYDAEFRSAAHATSEECQWVFEKIIQTCHGQKMYSRGGWFQFDDDGTTYGLDVQDDGVRGGPQ